LAEKLAEERAKEKALRQGRKRASDFMESAQGAGAEKSSKKAKESSKGKKSST
jgi:hypothetical protein